MKRPVTAVLPVLIALGWPVSAQQAPTQPPPPPPPPDAVDPLLEDEASLPPRRRRPRAGLWRFDYEPPDAINGIWMIDDPVLGFGNEALWEDPRPLHPSEGDGRDGDEAGDASLVQPD